MEEMWRREGEEREEIVVMAEEEKKGGGEEGEGETGVVRWERFLRRMSVRVLLVEGDDSTRHIIAALLRKCSYRVVAASDGLKAWETLKEKHQNIDLVLTEVELPKISGVSLLTMIMDHETCKNIPVIMMSSHDSMSMVFKCMLKGAADFLVKPIRKNELRNLWQHVWRRQIVSHGHGGHQDGNAKCEFEPEYGNHSTEYVACMQKYREYSDKGSDAESSCTRSDMEAESAHMQDMLDLKQKNSWDISLVEHSLAPIGETRTHLDSALLMHEGESNVAVTMNEDSVPTRCLNNKNITSETYGRNFDLDQPSNVVVDLTNQPQLIHAPRHGTAARDDFSNIAENHGHENEIMCKASPMPHLELSLRRYQDIYLEKQENDEWSILNHSNLSAFSVYHSRTGVPTSLTPRNFSTEHKECNSTSCKPRPHQGCSNASDASQFNGLRSNINLEDKKSLGVGLPAQDGMEVRCTPLRVVPLPIPAGGMSFDSLCAGYGPVMQPMYYPQSTHHLWSTIPSMWHGVQTLHSDHPNDQSARNPTYHSAEKQEETMELLDEQRHVSSATAESGSGSVCNGGRNGGASACNESIGHITGSNNFKATTESGNHDGTIAHEGTKPMDFYRLSQREEALNKFRMKRKDRCYEKKVRYQSRKLLAEQRPRVKGQFVRQVQLGLQSVGAGCYHGDPATE
ncbi:two-component response regulator-like PRR95 isoform X2 [Phoenix dactylifera]|uniref:Two-component response regulator-like PRR95 isoform X2 n=1 Tax=Phoenix dactylifera TaxID=42345 RepID=A0A8B7BIN0_PHODC|nr:two-component response regulator-like PRR95 isoform X2 [Phoenix dactylifera]